MVKDGKSEEDIPRFSLSGLCSLSSIADALPFPDSLASSDDSIVPLESENSDTTRHDISSLINALNTTRKFEIESEFDQRNSVNIKGELAQKIVIGHPSLFDKNNILSAKAIQDEKVAKKEKKRLKKEKKEKERTNGENLVENGIKHKKHKKEKKAQKEKEKAERKAERAEKRRKRDSRELGNDSRYC